MLIHAKWKEICKQFWKYKQKVWEQNIWYGIILQMPPDSSLVIVWAGQQIPRTEQGWVGEGDCKAIHRELRFAFSCLLVIYWSSQDEGELVLAGSTGTMSLQGWGHPKEAVLGSWELCWSMAWGGDGPGCPQTAACPARAAAQPLVWMHP